MLDSNAMWRLEILLARALVCLSLLFLGVIESVRMNSQEVAGIFQYGQSTNYGAFSFCQRVGATSDLCA